MGCISVSLPVGWVPIRRLGEVRFALDRASAALLTLLFLASGVVLSLSHRQAQDPVVRQQLKWLRNGLVCGFLPYAVLYLVPYVFGEQPSAAMRYSVLALPLIPLTIAYAIARYRLMDVDVIFRARVRLHRRDGLRARRVLRHHLFARQFRPEEL